MFLVKGALGAVSCETPRSRPYDPTEGCLHVRADLGRGRGERLRPLLLTDNTPRPMAPIFGGADLGGANFG